MLGTTYVIPNLIDDLGHAVVHVQGQLRLDVRQLAVVHVVAEDAVQEREFPFRRGDSEEQVRLA